MFSMDHPDRLRMLSWKYQTIDEMKKLFEQARSRADTRAHYPVKENQPGKIGRCNHFHARTAFRVQCSKWRFDAGEVHYKCI